ncbi:nucleoside kinase [Heliorestis acidaminivorans]|uniref:Nucleoside kinase n=1 Tax=Heliorestis acidaminivorans TaxID=553427 RepID=A0A6I0ERQ7_9FIRM|nr:nucleoside kinase [Heliorestis acidaminivorans]KAB2952333.1 nucleoside kinase [Heliorestis acidaminivorans]
MTTISKPSLALTIKTPQTGWFCRWWNRRTTLQVLAWELQAEHGAPIVAVKVNNKIENLQYLPEEDCTVEMVDMTSEAGIRVYARSLAFVLMRTARELYPEVDFEIQFSLNKGFYVERLGGEPLTLDMVEKMRERMWDIVRACEPIECQVMTIEEAKVKLLEHQREDQAAILKYRQREPVYLYRCGDYVEFSDEVLVPHTGLITTYQLEHHYAGFLLRFPDQNNPFQIPKNLEQKKLGYIFRESDRWTKIVGVSNVRDLNGHIEAGKTRELIRLAEALHEKRIAQIADKIAEEPERGRVILIAGPSSSGKTSFAQRLKIQLRVNGFNPVTLSLDDFFHPRRITPRDEAGNFDFESLYTVDLALFNEQLSKLIDGQTVEVPHYNFHSGEREYLGRELRIGIDQPIIVEGIHGLNEELTSHIDREQKFKIYVSALVELNLDLMNYIKTTDIRLLRRIIRDHKYRSRRAVETLTMWPSVRRGEERWIFPYQEDADVMFNSALLYEPAVLGAYAKPLLEAIDSSEEVYGDAQRLLTLLDYFRAMNDSEVPLTSILREFIGGSTFFRSK